jgi:hypothetical protein
MEYGRVHELIKEKFYTELRGLSLHIVLVGDLCGYSKYWIHPSSTLHVSVKQLKNGQIIL